MDPFIQSRYMTRVIGSTVRANWYSYATGDRGQSCGHRRSSQVHPSQSIESGMIRFLSLNTDDQAQVGICKCALAFLCRGLSEKATTAEMATG